MAWKQTLTYRDKDGQTYDIEELKRRFYAYIDLALFLQYTLTHKPHDAGQYAYDVYQKAKQIDNELCIVKPKRRRKE